MTVKVLGIREKLMVLKLYAEMHGWQLGDRITYQKFLDNPPRKIFFIKFLSYVIKGETILRIKFILFRGEKEIYSLENELHKNIVYQYVRDKIKPY